MNIRTRIICLALTMAALAIAQPAPASASAAQEPCSALTPATLPHTADAIEGWFRSCDRDRGRHVPPTADGAASWLNR